MMLVLLLGAIAACAVIAKEISNLKSKIPPTNAGMIQSVPELNISVSAELGTVINSLRGQLATFPAIYPVLFYLSLSLPATIG